jgi:hypothetical protein
VALFGDKKLVESLQSELASAKASLAAESAAKATLMRERETARRELTRAQELLAEYEQRISSLARPRRSPPDDRGGAAPLELPRQDDDEHGERPILRASYTIEGTAHQLEALDLVLRIATSAGEVGSTVFFDVMVDGDGGGRIVARRDGEILRLTDEETAVWFLGEEGEQSRRIRDVVREHGRIIVELV